MRQHGTPSAEALTISETLREINSYVTKYEEENKKCVSYYMLAAYAYTEKKESWIALLRKKIHRDVISSDLRTRRKFSKYSYAIPRLEAMEQYIEARAAYENQEMVAYEEMVHAEHERELREKENAEAH